MRITTDNPKAAHFHITDHGLACSDPKGDLLNVLCVACSRDGERPWAAIRVACANGETVEITATRRTLRTKTFRSPKP